MAILSKVLLTNGALSNSAQTFLGGDSLFTTGTVFFVHSGTGSDNNAGTDPGSPKATVQGAIDVCTAAKGDRVVVMPGHAETVTSTSINLNKSGVSVICIGSGLNRATFTYSTAAATITVSAANCGFYGGHHIANFLDVAAAFTVGAAKDFVMGYNTFVDSSASLNFESVILTGSTNNDADGLTIVGNYWLGLNTSPNAFVSILANEKRLTVTDNFIDLAATNDVGHFITLSSKIVTGTLIARNRAIIVGATNAAVGIFLTGSGTTSTGLVENNYVSSLDTTTELIATAGTGLVFIENYYTGTADASGKVWPAADGA